MEIRKKYYNIEKRTLAEALNFMGFKYYKFTGDKGIPIYGFEDTELFRKAMNELFNLRKAIYCK
ncbi:hypothetical protein [uncultured Clostridium sp.]|uniref:hypothetical protein n=1 Tax=uncultured Clostridium sp. TaxID=59620 RepID=UPI0028EF6016|nr:hypothetical protein [uncultured Clostridium sp.]